MSPLWGMVGRLFSFGLGEGPYEGTMRRTMKRSIVLPVGSIVGRFCFI